MPTPIAELNPDADQLERTRREPDDSKMTPNYTGVVESGNVIAEIPGTDLADEIVVIGGHLDSWDLGRVVTMVLALPLRWRSAPNQSRGPATSHHPGWCLGC